MSWDLWVQMGWELPRAQLLSHVYTVIWAFFHNADEIGLVGPPLSTTPIFDVYKLKKHRQEHCFDNPDLPKEHEISIHMR